MRVGLAKREQCSQARGQPGPELGPEGFDRRREELARSTDFWLCFITGVLGSQRRALREKYNKVCAFIHSTDSTDVRLYSDSGRHIRKKPGPYSHGKRCDYRKWVVGAIRHGR